MENWCHVRSISLPSKSHPTTLKIQEELNKLRTSEASSTSALGAISNGLSGLGELYNCMDELTLPSTQQAISLHQHERWANELLDGSIILLDICGVTRDAISQFKENIGDLWSALKRRKGDLCTESSINNYNTSRKKLSKDAKKLLGVLKKMYNKFEASPLLDQDHQTSTVIRVLKEVTIMSISIFQSLLLLFSSPILKSRPSRWSLVSKFMHKGTVACEEKHQNMELENVDIILVAISSEESNLEKMQLACKGMKALEISIEGLNNGLDSMFRHLIKTRASLLNTISH